MRVAWAGSRGGAVLQLTYNLLCEREKKKVKVVARPGPALPITLSGFPSARRRVETPRGDGDTAAGVSRQPRWHGCRCPVPHAEEPSGQCLHAPGSALLPPGPCCLSAASAASSAPCSSEPDLLLVSWERRFSPFVGRDLILFSGLLPPPQIAYSAFAQELDSAAVFPTTMKEKAVKHLPMFSQLFKGL